MGKVASKMLQLGATSTTAITVNKQQQPTTMVQGEMMEVDSFTLINKKHQLDGLLSLEDGEEDTTYVHDNKKLKVMVDGEKTQVIVVPRRKKSHPKLKTEGQEDDEDDYPHKRSNSIAISPISTFQFQSPIEEKCEIEYGDACITEEDDITSSEPVPELPVEVLNSIFEYVKLEDRCMASMVNRYWLKAAWLRVTRMEFNLRHRPDQESIIIRTLQKCSNVRSVVLRDCYNVSGRILRYLPATVQSFEFFNCGNLSKTVCNEDIKYLPRDMNSLSLRNCENISDEAVPYLPQSLKNLDLSGSKLSEVGISKLPQSLKSLTLARCQNPLNTLSLTESLVTLDVSSCVLESEAFSALPPFIRSLNLAGCVSLTDKHLQQLAVLSELKTLTLENSEKITFAGIEGLPESIQNLNIRQCVGLNDRAIQSLPTNLKELSVCRCKSVTKLGFVRLPSSLVSLKLGHTNITDDIVAMLPQNLTSLSLFGSKQVTDNALSSLPQNIKELDLSWSSITDKGLNKMMDRLPYLTKVNLANTKVSKEGMILLENNFPGLKVMKGARCCDF